MVESGAVMSITSSQAKCRLKASQLTRSVHHLCHWTIDPLVAPSSEQNAEPTPTENWGPRVVPGPHVPVGPPRRSTREYFQKYEGRNCDVLLNSICYITCIVLYHNCACVILVPLMWFCSFSIYCWCTMFYPSCDLYMNCWMTVCIANRRQNITQTLYFQYKT